MRHANEAAERIAKFIESMFEAPGMHAASSAELEMSLITALQCHQLASGTVNEGRVVALWRHEVQQLHGYHGSSVKTLSDLPSGGKAMTFNSVLEGMRRIWVTLTEPVTTIAVLHREL